MRGVARITKDLKNKMPKPVKRPTVEAFLKKMKITDAHPRGEPEGESSDDLPDLVEISDDDDTSSTEIEEFSSECVGFCDLAIYRYRNRAFSRVLPQVSQLRLTCAGASGHARHTCIWTRNVRISGDKSC